MGLTQSAIAEKLGLSRRAVGFALSESPHARKQVGAATRRRVLDTAQELGYRPHRYAQIMRGKKSGLIGVMKPTALVQTVLERSVSASKAIEAAGYGLVVNELHWDHAGLRRAVSALLDQCVEGVLLDGISWQAAAALAELQRLRAANIPMVVLGSAPVPGIASVMSDYRQGMAEMTRHLLARGHRRLMLVCPVRAADLNLSQHWGYAERRAGFREAAAAAGLTTDEAQVLYLPSADWLDRYETGPRAIEQLAAGGERPEVLLCNNDECAIGAIVACVKAGWRVPEDMAVTGFDNTTAGRYFIPALTSVAQPTEATAQEAVRMLLEQIRGGTIPSSVTLPCQLVVRQSCGQ